MNRTPRSAWAVRRRRRRLVWPTLLAVLTLMGVLAAPGAASAAPKTVTPLVDCYVSNGDGSVTVVLGYTSTWPNQVSIPLTNGKNYIDAGDLSSQLPTRFEEGTHHGVATLRLSQADLAGVSWYLDGTTLDIAAASRSAGECSATQLPAMANGAALVLGVGLAGVAGVVMARRRRAGAGGLQPAGHGQLHA